MYILYIYIYIEREREREIERNQIERRDVGSRERPTSCLPVQNPFPPFQAFVSKHIYNRSIDRSVRRPVSVYPSIHPSDQLHLICSLHGVIYHNMYSTYYTNANPSPSDSSLGGVLTWGIGCNLLSQWPCAAVP